ncbi:putative Fe-S cluster-containing protein [Hydrogenispora ethanolica]|uniref:Putative Fe-S cluster-containing protein n=1 Tax=Hydrogenispora ethanolica TaxID=1082276 RepID=A0A4R1S0I5_HYDET|nr:(Fe-S)-binding protein [Hydrogenispora ethanolica]TCL72429.1 putative Fe-S cluster-containing protein [Hydrogenispora ethanolica]
MRTVRHWQPPQKNCGLCGSKSCADFMTSVSNQEKELPDCPFYHREALQHPQPLDTAAYSGADILGNRYDFVLGALPGEISARKIVLPFRSDLVEKLAIHKGDLVLGRPMGAGCPIPHVLSVIEADPVTGLLYTWVVGPKWAREKETKDVHAYHMIGFEGVAKEVAREPVLGCRATFLPGFCMMNLNHTGLVNMALQKSYGLQIRIEDIRILAGAKGTS